MSFCVCGRKAGSSILLGLRSKPPVMGQAGNSESGSRQAINDSGVMTTSKISVVVAPVSPPLLIPRSSAIESAECVAGPSSCSTLSCTLQFIQGVANLPAVIMLINYPRQTPPDNDRLPIASAYPVIFIVAFCPGLTPTWGRMSDAERRHLVRPEQ